MGVSDSDAGVRVGLGARAVAAAVLVALTALGVIAVGITTDVEVISADAGADVFSADRARTAVEPIVSTPRVPGTAEHRAARDRLVADLSALGWDTEVVDGVGLRHTGERITRVARVDNIVATLPGTDPTGTVMLAAHYDTVPGSRGAADDGLGVATALEAARAIAATGPHRNTVTVLLTDGEESGLLGAEAFTRGRDFSSGAPVVVINHEARGSSGLPAIFRTSSPNADLVRIVSGIRGATADTGSQAAFELMPNDTDFTVFEAAGMAGIDTAITGSSANYHSVTDTPDRLSSASLQRMGSVTLAATEELASMDLSTIDAGGSFVAASVLNGTVRAPRWVELALVAVTLLAAALLVVRGIRAGDRRRAIAATAAVGLLLLPLGAVAAAVPWWVASTVAPTMVSSIVGDPYRPGAFQIAAFAATVAAVLAVITVLRRWVTRSEMVSGLLFGATVLVVGASALPGFALTFGAAVLAAIVGAVAAGRLRPAVASVVAGVAAVPAVVLLVPFAVTIFEVGLEIGGAAAGLTAVVVLACGYPIIDILLRRRRAPTRPAIVPAVAIGVVTAVVAGVVGVIANAASPEQPIQESFGYALDLDSGTASYIGSTGPRSDWAEGLMPERAEIEVPGNDVARLPVGSAPVVDLPAPEVDVLSDTRVGDRRTLELRLRSPREASGFFLRTADEVVLVDGPVVAGQRIPAAAGAPLRLLFIGDSQVTVRFTVPASTDTLDLRVVDISPDLTDITELAPPDDVVINSPATYVSHTVTF